MASDDVLGKPLQGWRLALYTIIFEADTRAGRLFDLALIAAIVVSVCVVVLDSVQSIAAQWHSTFFVLEWFSPWCSRWSTWHAWLACAIRCAMR